jgi:hypothetical protein
MKRELILIFAFSSLLALCVAANKYFEAEPSDPQRYTVHFDGIDYQDLTREGLKGEWSAYKTKAGKRIEFHGNFYEVEQ